MIGRDADDNSEGAFFALVRGRVQGVGFRYSACREADRLGLTGWARNTPDRSVEIWAEGPPENLAAFRQWLQQGPPRARVDELIVEAKTATGVYRTFSAG
jgi:acylphosphatase